MKFGSLELATSAARLPASSVLLDIKRVRR